MNKKEDVTDEGSYPRGKGHRGQLGRKLARAGHALKFGVRNVNAPDLQALVKELGANASAGSVAEAVQFGDVVIFAIPGASMEETIRVHGQLLQGKIVIDAANRIGDAVMNSAAAFAAHAPGAKVFRAFSNLGWENFADPQFGDVQADLIYCGTEGEGQAAVERLIVDVGLRPVRVGDLAQIQLVDMVGGLWFALAVGQGMGRHLAFKVLTRQ